MLQSVLIKLAMLSATLSVIVGIGWTVPPSPGEAGADGASTVLGEPEVTSPPAAPREVLPHPSLPVSRPVRTASSQLQPRRSAAQPVVDMNHATLRELDQLPGIGQALAERVVEYRRSHGPFAAVEDLLLVKGIGPKKLERLRGLVRVGSQATRDNQEGRL
ncbi:ComEA family DNA-binding protein [Nitrospira sp. Nam80]